MKKIFLAVAFIYPFLAQAQIEEKENEEIELNKRPLKGAKTGNDSITYFKTKITDYKVWTQSTAPTAIDTTLSIQNYYNQNFTKKDLFARMLFPNSGAAVVELEYVDQPFVRHLLPTGKKHNYYFANEIKYYDVKTPYTEFIYEAGVKEGNFLSTTFAHNLHSRLNYALHYRGMTSEGRFKQESTTNNSFVFSTNYRTVNERFKLWGHYAAQNLTAKENSGIKDIYDFIDADERNLTNVRNIDVNTPTAKSEFDARRGELNMQYGILKQINPADSSIYHPITLKNTLTYEKQKFRYLEDSSENYYTSLVIPNLRRNDFKSSINFANETTAGFQWTDRLMAEAGIKFQQIDVFADQPLSFVNAENNIEIHLPKKWKQTLFGVVGKLNFDWNERLKLKANAEYLQSDEYKSLYTVEGVLDVQPIKGYTLSAGILAQANIPSLNVIYNQSFYADFNYNNQFETENVQKVFGRLSLDKFNTSVEASFYNIDNHVYYGEDYKPAQLNDNINYFKVKLFNHLTYGNFNLVSTVQYQNVSKNEEYMPLPDLILRESVYWQGKLFNDKAEVQAGFNANYFTKYKAFQYFPVVNEFKQQDATKDIQEIGNFPMIDLFINFKVQNMRFYIRGEHLNAIFSDRNYFSAPGVPFRAFKFQLGLKWNIFT